MSKGKNGNMEKVRVELVVPGNGEWVFINELFYQVMHFVYWTDGRRRWFSVQTFGDQDWSEGRVNMVRFDGRRFPSKAEARWWAKHSRIEFNEGEY